MPDRGEITEVEREHFYSRAARRLTNFIDSHLSLFDRTTRDEYMRATSSQLACRDEADACIRAGNQRNAA